MTLQFVESHDSRKITQGVSESVLRRKWTAFREASEVIVKAALLSTAGSLFNGLPLSNIDADPQGGGIWKCTADYSLRVPENPSNTEDGEALGPAYSIDLTAGTQHVTQSLETVDSAWIGDGPDPDYKRAVKVTKDRVEGTDIFVPKFEFGITVKTYPVTPEFVRTLRSSGAKTNNAPWKGFETGEVLYLGCTGQCEPNSYWTLSHKFVVGENKEVTVNGMTVTKGAHDFLWCTYRQSKISDSVVAEVPIGVKVERMYDSADFNLLRLNPPIANFTASPTSGMHPLTVQFLDLSSGSPLVWFWTFGDGTSSSAQHPLKTYALPGVYTVSLTVTNGAGQSFMTRINYITVS